MVLSSCGGDLDEYGAELLDLWLSGVNFLFVMHSKKNIFMKSVWHYFMLLFSKIKCYLFCFKGLTITSVGHA